VDKERFVKKGGLLFVVAVVAEVVSGGSVARAQEPNLEMLAARLKANQEELQQYTWDSKVVFEVDGVQQQVDVFRVRYVMGGMKERMQISGETAKKKVRAADGKKLNKKEREAGREFVTKAEDQAGAYLNPLFAERAVTTAEVHDEDGVPRLVSKDVMTTGDSVVIEFAPGWGPATRADIKTTVEGSPVELEIFFDGVEHGPRYPVRSTTTTTWQGLPIKILSENSNFVKKQD
jgi:hypothetical protein